MAQFEVIALDTTTPQLRAPGSGDSYLMPRSLAVGGETVTTSSPVLDLSQSWNNNLVTFTGIKFNVASDVSAAGSLLMDLQVGGVTKFAVKKDGYLNFGGSFGIQWGNTLRVTNAAGTTWAALSSKSLALTQVTASTGAISWSTGFPDGDSGTADLFLYRDGLAGTLAQRNGVNPQAFRLYNTYVDASNYERGRIEWATNELKIGTENGGSYITSRNIGIYVNSTRRALFSSSTFILDSGIDCGSINSSSSIIAGTANGIGWNSRGYLFASSDGVFRLTDSSVSSFNRLQFGGTTSSFPALKRSTTVLQARLADDSDYTNIQGKIQTHTNAVAETPTATHTITIYDAAGTAYKVLAVPA